MNQNKHLKPLWSALIGIVSLSTLIVSCQEKEGEGKKTLSFVNASDQHIKLYHGESYLIQITGAAASPSWFVSDMNIATIDVTGLMLGRLIGESTFLVRFGDQKLQGRVSIEPRHNAYREPLYGNAVSRKQVEAYENRDFEKEQPFVEHQVLLRYKGEHPEIKRVVYIYDKLNDRVLQAYVELASLDAYTSLRCLDFLSERYHRLGDDQGNTAPDGRTTPVFGRGDVMVKPRKIGNSGAIFYVDPTKE